MTGEYLTTQMCLQVPRPDLQGTRTGRSTGIGVVAARVRRRLATTPSSEPGQERRDQHLQGQVGISQGRTRPGDQGLEEKCLKRDRQHE
jgi:hypothetical protein